MKLKYGVFQKKRNSLTQKQYQKLQKHLEKYIYTKILRVLLKMIPISLKTCLATFYKIRKHVHLSSITQDYFRDCVVLAQTASDMIRKEMTCGVHKGQS